MSDHTRKDGLEPQPLGATGLMVSPICIGTSPLGSMPQLYGYEVDADAAIDTVLAAFASPLTFLDTSNNYGAGESERRIGAAIRRNGGLPDGFVLGTKVDPDPVTGDFSGRRARESVAESLERLHLDHLQLLHLHDPEVIGFERAMAPDGPVTAMLELQQEGVVDHLGIAGGPIDLLRRFVATDHFSVVITHNRWTLLDRSAEPLIRDANERGIAVLNAAPYGGGILAKGPAHNQRYAYGPADQRVIDRARAMQDACARHGVPLPAAALQFSVHDPRITSTVVGVSSPAHIQRTLELQAVVLPETLLEELDAFVAPEELWLR